jgi:sulfur-carrier protein
MAVVHFTSHLQSFVNSEPVEVVGETVGAALATALAGRDQLRTYILDDQNRLRRHVMIFVDGQMIVDRLGLSDAVKSDSEVYVMQALSGG